MANLRTYRNFCPSNSKDELSEKVSIEDNSILILILAAYRASTPVFALIFTQNLPNKYIDEDLQKTAKLALKLFVQI